MTQYGRYEVIEELGRGAMGVVYKAHDPHIDRIVALKALRQDRMTSEDFVQRFLKEAKAIGRLSHQNIVAVYDIGQDQGTIYIAMEFLEGKPLNEIPGNDKLSAEQVIDIGFQVADALEYAHGKGIVHRDIKPTNIIITPEGQVKITDFGIAHIEDPEAAQQTQAGEILGTPAYMSPEQVKGRPADRRTDLFSLGIILYELLTGVRPFRGDGMMAIFRSILEDSPPSPISLDPTVPKPLSDLVVKCLNKSPEKRFQTGRAFADALAASRTSGQQNSPTNRKNIYMFGGLLLLLLAGSGIYLFQGKAPTNEGSRQATESTTPVLAANAALKVNSIPPGAQVFVDGSFNGETPLKIMVSAGKHEVRLTLTDYYEWEAQLQVTAESETPVYARLIPIDLQ